MAYQYQKYNQYFAPVTGKMESLLGEELAKLGAHTIHEGYRGVQFQADPEVMYRINYESRFATRILAPLTTFKCKNPTILLNATKRINWEDFFGLDETFAITASISDSIGFTNSLFAAQRMKDGIADHFNEKYGERPSVDLKNPDVRLNLHIRNNRAVISIDCSRDALHKRGYRRQKVFAPMQETLAAAIVHHSGWTGEKPLWDFMCGSGTLLAEALMAYCNIPAQYLRRKFGFFSLPDFDLEKWREVKKSANDKIRDLPEGLIFGSDKDRKSILAAQQNLEMLPGGENVEFSRKMFQDTEEYINGTIIANPPYGIRLGEREEAVELYKEIGDFLKKKCNGTSAYIYTGDKTLARSFRLKPSRRVELINGQLDGVLLEIKSFRVDFRQGDGESK